ncbi:MAG: FAD-binding oxidoreductase [Alphaproteobacteria bacterium]|nr:FAD-binding oxidoreductase [Alphaproteobacteria bacterium]
MPMITEATPVAHADPLPDAVDVVVIGAGIIGTSTAWFLGQRGAKVALLEKGRVAGEQSSRNWGWVRQQGRDRDELPIVMESNRIWRNLATETGERDLAFTGCGLAYLAEDERALAKYAEWHDIAREHQLDTRMLSPAEAQAACPGLEGRWVGGMLTPSDGRAEPFVAVPALARAVQRLGVSITEDCAVRALETRAGRVAGVHTERGPVWADRVVLAGGAWSTYFARNAGIDLPQLIVRSTVGRTHPAADRGLPNVAAPGFATNRRADGGHTVTTGDLVEHYVGARSFRDLTKFVNLMRKSARDLRLRPKPPAGYPGAWGSRARWTADEVTPFEQMRVLNPPPSQEGQRRLMRRLPERAPWLHEAGIAETWAGMIDVTPDAVPYICEVPSLPGLFIGTGMSGHGFGIGPGVGRVLGDLVLDRPTGLDLTRFRFERFADGSPVVPGPY